MVVRTTHGNGGCVTQMHYARKGVITPEMAYVAEREGLDAEVIRAEVARGRLIIPCNIYHSCLEPMGIGTVASVKINANIGNSALISDIDAELQKLKLAIRYGADTVMDLSTGGRIDEIRCAIIAASPVPVGTVPLYQAVAGVNQVEDLTADDMIDMIERQAKQGVDYMTIHAGVLLEHLPLVQSRITGIVSRGGALMARWMLAHNAQNPLYTHFEQICRIFRQYDVSCSLGDGLHCLELSCDWTPLEPSLLPPKLAPAEFRHAIP